MRVYFYKGKKRLFDRLVSWWTKGDFSHVEIEFSDGYSYSSSVRDGGVRKKKIDYKPEHWEILVIPNTTGMLVKKDEFHIKEFLEVQLGKKYDYFGLFGFILPPLDDIPERYFCSELIADALDLPDAWRYSPNMLYAVLNAAYGRPKW
jgi:hypothetical protein